MTGTVIAVVVAALGSGGLGSLVTAIYGGRKAVAESSTADRAQFTAEFREVVEAQRYLMGQIREELAAVKAEVVGLRLEHRAAEDYIDLLLIGIADGTIPPIPNRNVSTV